ncbi:MAG: hypothetical protein ACRDJH_04920 [Thermomicrobiales bacterium]
MKNEEKPDKRVVVSICGASGSGKSRLAQAIVEKLGDDVAVRVPTDYYLMPATEPLGSYFAKPLRYDWPLLARAIALPEGVLTSTPDFDFETFQRRGDTGGRPFVPRRVVLTDAIYPYPGAGATILLMVPDAARRARIADRDTVWGTNVVARWEHLELSHSRLKSLNVGYHLELSGDDDLGQTGAFVAMWLRDRYPNLVRRR